MPTLMIKFFLEHPYAFTAYKDAQSRKNQEGQQEGRLWTLLLNGLGIRRIQVQALLLHFQLWILAQIIWVLSEDFLIYETEITTVLSIF